MANATNKANARQSKAHEGRYKAYKNNDTLPVNRVRRMAKHALRYVDHKTADRVAAVDVTIRKKAGINAADLKTSIIAKNLYRNKRGRDVRRELRAA